MPLRDELDEARLGTADVLNRLPGNWSRQEADAVAGVPGLQRHTDFAVGLHPADARSVTRTGIENDEWPLSGIDAGARWGNDTGQAVIHGTLQALPRHDDLVFEGEHVGGFAFDLGKMLVTPFTQHIEKEDAPLPGVQPVIERRIAQGHSTYVLLFRPIAGRRLLQHNCSPYRIRKLNDSLLTRHP